MASLTTITIHDETINSVVHQFPNDQAAKRWFIKWITPQLDNAYYNGYDDDGAVHCGTPEIAWEYINDDLILASLSSDPAKCIECTQCTVVDHVVVEDHDECLARLTGDGMIAFQWRSGDNVSAFLVTDPEEIKYGEWIDFLDGKLRHLNFYEGDGEGFFEKNGAQLRMVSGPSGGGGDVEASITVDFKRASDVLRIVIEELKLRGDWK
jgi:hypothetical protein